MELVMARRRAEISGKQLAALRRLYSDDGWGTAWRDGVVDDEGREVIACYTRLPSRAAQVLDYLRRKNRDRATTDDDR